ncbi:Arv1-domain-containing protein [Atractiella rhizophila]|nr:Arv1-domain-containing protein [Atractiella rhizophila]
MPRCVTCNLPVEALYTLYSAGHYSLLECPSCKNLVDPYVEFEAPIILLDLFLLKPRAYRHCIHNRNGDWLPLLTALTGMDTFVRWWPSHTTPTSLTSSLMLLLHSLRRSITETALFFIGVTLSCYLLKTFDRRNTSFIPSLAPLALLYSSLPPALLLFLSLIWTPSSAPSTSTSPPPSTFGNRELFGFGLGAEEWASRIGRDWGWEWDRMEVVRFALKRVYAVAGVWVVMGGSKR